MGANTVVLITGANSGIGYEIARALLQSTTSSYHVLVGLRSAEKGESAVTQLSGEFPSSHSTAELLQVDVDSDNSIKAAFDIVKKNHGRVDVLINNAGVAHDIDAVLGKLTTREAFNKMYNTNVTGSHIMTDIFQPLLLNSEDPRLLFVTSGLAQIQQLARAPLDLDGAGEPVPPEKLYEVLRTLNGYRASKMALNSIILTWYWLLKDKVKVWGISPGILATDMGGNKELAEVTGAKHPSLGGILVKKVVEGVHDADVGKVVGQDSIMPW